MALTLTAVWKAPDPSTAAMKVLRELARLALVVLALVFVLVQSTLQRR